MGCRKIRCRRNWALDSWNLEGVGVGLPSFLEELVRQVHWDVFVIQELVSSMSEDGFGRFRGRCRGHVLVRDPSGGCDLAFVVDRRWLGAVDSAVPWLVAGGGSGILLLDLAFADGSAVRIANVHMPHSWGADSECRWAAVLDSPTEAIRSPPPSAPAGSFLAMAVGGWNAELSSEGASESLLDLQTRFAAEVLWSKHVCRTCPCLLLTPTLARSAFRNQFVFAQLVNEWMFMNKLKTRKLL